ncbi:MAG: hypothetical protein ABIA78_03770 [archaeon]
MINIKKISAVISSSIIAVSTIGFAAAANFPAPFVVGSSADVAIVYGTGTGVSSLDLVQAGNIQSNLQSALPSSGTGGSSSVTGGDSVLLAKSSDHLNLNNNWGVFTGTVDDDELPVLLADGTYIADDNDEFTYEQKISLGTPTLTHFRDSDYESLIGASVKTPTIGFRITSNTYIMNYTLDFLEDVTSDIVSSRWDDVEGSDIPLMGKTYYVSELQNGSTAATFGKMILLDSANIGNVKEGETVTVSGKEVSIDWIDADEVVFIVDGQRAPASGKLIKGNSFKLNDGSYLGVRDVTKLAVSGEIGGASFSIGSGKLEFPSVGGEIKMNDDTITGLKGFVQMNTAGTKLDKIVIEWKTDGEQYLSPTQELKMPGFGALKFAMNELVRNEEEKITIAKDSDTSIEVTMPIKDGEVNFNLLYSNSSGEFEGLGKSATERLLTSPSTNITFYERESGNDFHEYFIATYNISKEGESYLLKAAVSQDITAGRNETTIQKYDGSSWTDACTEKAEGDTCDIGDVSMKVWFINYTSGGNESVMLEAQSNTNFHSVITPSGLVMWLPYDGGYWNDDGAAISIINTTYDWGAFNATATMNATGNNWDKFYLYFSPEDKDETLGAGTDFAVTLEDTSDNKLHVSAVNMSVSIASGTFGAGIGAGTAGPTGLEQGGTGVYEAYVLDDVASKVLHYTSPDEDSVEVYYPSGESETYAEVYLTEQGASLTSTPGVSSGSLGEVLAKDSEVSSVSSKNLIIVGGSCINSAAATALGVSYPTCTTGFTTATTVGSGEFLIKGVSGAFTTGKIALVVAGYEAADTVNAAKYLTTKTVDTSKEYIGTTATADATEVTATA